MKGTKRILEVKIVHETDTNPDTSYFGEYTEHWSPWAVDRAHSLNCPMNQQASESLTCWCDLNECDCERCDCNQRGNMQRGEYRYFRPSFNYVNEKGEPQEGTTPEDVIKYTRQDYERMEALERREWGYIGISARAEVQVNGSIVQTINSGGLWGIEDDSDREYFESVEQDELVELKAELQALGFGTRAISKAFQTVERVSQ